MKLADKPRIELLYTVDNLIIPLRKGQTHVLNDFLKGLEEIDLNKEYEVKIARKKVKRSLDANSYYWKLLTEVAEKKNITTTEYHNKNLANLGIPWRNENGQMVWYFIKDDDEWLKMEKNHLRPVDETEDRKGVMYRWFYLLKPSHLMDTKEFSRLIDNLVQDAKTLGIETKTPDEIKAMMAAWKGGKNNALQNFND